MSETSNQDLPIHTNVTDIQGYERHRDEMPEFLKKYGDHLRQYISDELGAVGLATLDEYAAGVVNGSIPVDRARPIEQALHKLSTLVNASSGVLLPEPTIRHVELSQDNRGLWIHALPDGTIFAERTGGDSAAFVMDPNMKTSTHVHTIIGRDSIFRSDGTIVYNKEHDSGELDIWEWDPTTGGDRRIYVPGHSKNGGYKLLGELDDYIVYAYGFTRTTMNTCIKVETKTGQASDMPVPIQYVIVGMTSKGLLKLQSVSRPGVVLQESMLYDIPSESIVARVKERTAFFGGCTELPDGSFIYRDRPLVGNKHGIMKRWDPHETSTRDMFFAKIELDVAEKEKISVDEGYNSLKLHPLYPEYFITVSSPSRNICVIDQRGTTVAVIPTSKDIQLAKRSMFTVYPFVVTKDGYIGIGDHNELLLIKLD